jgi:adenine-specific DNA-methyltransferase
MKYMGSKRWMLSNGLGTLLVEHSAHAERFVDLFSGTAAVSWHVAAGTDVPVLAADLQTYSAVLARAVVGRTRELGIAQLVEQWVESSEQRSAEDPLWSKANRFDIDGLTAQQVLRARKLCAGADGPITRAYGGYYFSPAQAIMIDSLRAELPDREPKRSVCLASLIWAVTRCVASPGHTAQPFQPTNTALPFIREAWLKDVVSATRDVLPTIATRSAKVRGRAVVGDATSVVERDVCAGDLVFLDPPYSAAQYSRFYHVLETLALGSCGAVTGEGRYPPPEERPRSLFSLRSQAAPALEELLNALGRTGCEVIMTFPQQSCSNGLVGEDIVGLARQWFEVDISTVVMKHSTLGGNNTYRASRRSSLELIMSMKPKTSRRGRSNHR